MDDIILRRVSDQITNLNSLIVLLSVETDREMPFGIKEKIQVLVDACIDARNVLRECHVDLARPAERR